MRMGSFCGELFPEHMLVVLRVLVVQILIVLMIVVLVAKVVNCTDHHTNPSSKRATKTERTWKTVISSLNSSIVLP